jgi:phosphoribosylanthranilate isomerase
VSVPVAVKICGLTTRADAEHAVAAGAEFLGVILAPGRRTVAPREAMEILTGLPARGVGVFVGASPVAALEVADLCGLHAIQLHGDEQPDYICTLREEWEGAIWRAVRPRDARELLREVERFHGLVDALLLDGFAPDARGGTGARFPWNEVAAVRDRLPDDLPLVVAGGLTPANVAEAVRLLRPDVVDVSSGVERALRHKDPVAVSSFISRARDALAPRSQEAKSP